MAELSTSDEIELADISGLELVPLRENAVAGLLHITLTRLRTWLFGEPAVFDLTGPADGDVIAFDVGTGAWKPAAPSGGGGSAPTEVIIVALGDEVTDVAAVAAQVTIRMPYAFTLTGVRSSLTTASSSGLVTVDINEAGATILSTKLSIDSGEKTSVTAATAAVISDTALADNAEITFDIDAAGTGAKGLKVYMIGHQ